jgi:hypothetical protein
MQSTYRNRLLTTQVSCTEFIQTLSNDSKDQILRQGKEREILLFFKRPEWLWGPAILLSKA